MFPPGFFRCWALLFPSAHPAGLLSTGAPSAPSAGWDPAALFSRGTAWAGSSWESLSSRGASLRRLRAGSRRVPPLSAGSPRAPCRAPGHRAGTRRPRPAPAAGAVSPAAAAEQPRPVRTPARSLPVAAGPHEWPRAAPSTESRKTPNPSVTLAPAPSGPVTFLAPALPPVPK